MPSSCKLDRRLANGGVHAGVLHDVSAKSCLVIDDAAATLFIAGIAAREAKRRGAGPVAELPQRSLRARALASRPVVTDVVHAQLLDYDAPLTVADEARDGTPAAHRRWGRRGPVGRLTAASARRERR